MDKKYAILGVILVASVVIAGCIGQSSAGEINATVQYSDTTIDTTVSDSTDAESASASITDDSTPTDDQQVPDY